MENRRNHQCMSCAGPLWTAVNPSVPSPWVKIPEYGWVHRKLAVHAMQKTKNPAALDAFADASREPGRVLSDARRVPAVSAQLLHQEAVPRQA